MPFKSLAQRRWMYAAERRGDMPHGTAGRWQKHTPEGTKLPERKHPKPTKEAFAAAFLAKCAAAGLTTPDQIKAAAENLAAALEGRPQKRASVIDILTKPTGAVLGTAAGLAPLVPLVGSVGLPVAAGLTAGGVFAGMRNRADADDADTLRMKAVANAYRRRADEARLHNQVKALVASDPRKYVAIG